MTSKSKSYMPNNNFRKSGSSLRYPRSILALGGPASSSRQVFEKNPRYALDWDDYYDHDTILEFLDALAAQYEWVNSVSIGKSYEGRDQRVIQITKAGPGAPNAWFEAGEE